MEVSRLTNSNQNFSLILRRASSHSLVLFYTGRGNYVAINADDDIAQHYEKAKLEDIALRNPRFYLIEFDDFALLKKLLPLVADDSRIWVDNDHGEILHGPHFVSRVKQPPTWDWRISQTT